MREKQGPEFEWRFRCRECDAKAKAVVSVEAQPNGTRRRWSLRLGQSTRTTRASRWLGAAGPSS